MRVVTELVSGICNSNCIWCFTQYKSGEYIKKAIMSKNNFNKIIKLNPPLDIISFSHGESLLHPNFNEIIEFASTNKCKLKHIHSNFSMNLTDLHFKTLSNFDSIIVNIGGLDADTHFKNMGTDFNKVIYNINKLCKFVRKTKINIKMVLNKNNIHQRHQLLNFSKKINKNICSETYPIYFTTSDLSDQKEKLRFYENNINENVPCRDEIYFKDGEIFTKPKVFETCKNMVLTIRYNGKVQLCCRSRKEEGIIGNAFNTSLKNIIKTDLYKESVNKLKKRTYISYCEVCS